MRSFSAHLPKRGREIQDVADFAAISSGLFAASRENLLRQVIWFLCGVFHHGRKTAKFLKKNLKKRHTRRRLGGRQRRAGCSLEKCVRSATSWCAPEQNQPRANPHFLDQSPISNCMHAEVKAAVRTGGAGGRVVMGGGVGLEGEGGVSGHLVPSAPPKLHQNRQTKQTRSARARRIKICLCRARREAWRVVNGNKPGLHDF